MIEAILSKLNAIPADKVAHFASGVLLYAMTVHWAGPRYALALVILAGVAKEIYDSFHRDTHTPDVFDAVATSLGGVVAFSITLA